MVWSCHLLAFRHYFSNFSILLREHGMIRTTCTVSPSILQRSQLSTTKAKCQHHVFVCVNYKDAVIRSRLQRQSSRNQKSHYQNQTSTSTWDWGVHRCLRKQSFGRLQILITFFFSVFFLLTTFSKSQPGTISAFCFKASQLINPLLNNWVLNLGVLRIQNIISAY